jgi:nitrogen fixation/metabolism regulation signal transduction histidine kinase
MLAPRTIRRRMFIAIFAVALLPAAAALALGTYVLREAGATSGTLGPWDQVAESGSALVDEALRAAPGDSAVARAADAHRDALSASVQKSRLWTFVADRFAHALPLLALVSVLLLGAVAFLAAGWLSRSFSGPVTELVGWTRRIAASEALPAEPRGSSRDVLEFTQLRDALRRMAEDLAEGRRRDVEAARLRAWTEMARRVAHDLKNPLTPMQLAAGMLAGSTDERTRSAAAVLTEEIARLDEMARSLSHLGRAPDSPVSEVDLGELLERLAERHGSDAVPIAVERSGDTLVRGHHDLLERVFRNLLVNAVEASSPGSGSVDVGVARSNGRVRVTIRDHGAGLPEQLADSIWLPDVTTKRRGTGLGLAIVRQGVETHGGRVDAHNAAGGGAEFEVELPATSASSPS